MLGKARALVSSETVYRGSTPRLAFVGQGAAWRDVARQGAAWRGLARDSFESAKLTTGEFNEP